MGKEIWMKEHQCDLHLRISLHSTPSRIGVGANPPLTPHADLAQTAGPNAKAPTCVKAIDDSQDQELTGLLNELSLEAGAEEGIS